MKLLHVVPVLCALALSNCGNSDDNDSDDDSDKNAEGEVTGYVYTTGSFTPNFRNNVSVYEIDAATGSLTQVQSLDSEPLDDYPDASRISLTPDGKFAYVSYARSRGIHLFSIDPTAGTLTLLDNAATLEIESSDLAVSPDGKLLFASDRQHSFEVFGINEASGALTKLGSKTVGLGIHLPLMAVSPDGAHVYFFGQNGLTAFSYLVSEGSISFTNIDVPPVAGSTNDGLELNADGTLLYVVTNLKKYVFQVDTATGALTQIQALDDGSEEDHCSSVWSEWTTKALYVSSACRYSTTDAPTKLFVFAIDGTTGQLTARPELVFTSTSLPSSYNPDASQGEDYLFGTTPDGLVGVKVDATSGALTEVPGGPFPIPGTSFGTIAVR